MHNVEKETKVDQCREPGCYEQAVEYQYNDGVNDVTIPVSQIQALIELSDVCEQEFYYSCFIVPLRDGDVDYAYWEDRNGEKQVYWTGSNYGFHVCDCHFVNYGSCLDEGVNGNTCNCDAMAPAPLTDSGKITNKTALPITKVFFGGINYSTEKADY